jgi:hypothetical protein
LMAPGSYDSEKDGHPVHLYVVSIFLMLGGGQATIGGKSPAVSATTNQTPHRDFDCLEYPEEGVLTCPLLSGLKHPFLFNTAALLEQRRIWVKDGRLGEPELQ